MGKNFANGLRNGTTAAVIYLAICLWTGAGKTATGLGALVLLVIICAATTVIATVTSGKGGAAG